MSTILDRLINVFTDHQEREASERGSQTTAERMRDQLLGQVMELRNNWSQDMRQYPSIHAHLEHEYVARIEQINANLLAMSQVAPVYAFVDPYKIRDAARDPQKFMEDQKAEDRQHAPAAPAPEVSEEYTARLHLLELFVKETNIPEAAAEDMRLYEQQHPGWSYREMLDDYADTLEANRILKENTSKFNEQLTTAYGYVPDDTVERKQEAGHEYGHGLVVASAGELIGVELRAAGATTAPVLMFVEDHGHQFELGNHVEVSQDALYGPEARTYSERIEVKPEAQQLIDKINREIVSYEMRAKDISDDAYTDSAENRDTRSMLQVIRDHVSSGRRDIDLTTEVDYMQDITGVALDKDVYERTVSRVGEFIEQAGALGHVVSTTDFGENDREHRWDFAEPREEYAAMIREGEPEDRYDIHTGPESVSMGGKLTRAIQLEPSDNAMLRNIPREFAPEA